MKKVTNKKENAEKTEKTEKKVDESNILRNILPSAVQPFNQNFRGYFNNKIQEKDEIIYKKEEGSITKIYKDNKNRLRFDLLVDGEKGMCIYVYMYVCLCMYVHMLSCMYSCIRTTIKFKKKMKSYTKRRGFHYKNLYVYMCICMCVCVYIYICCRVCIHV